MTDILDVIESIRGTLRDAYKQATTDDQRQKIKGELSDLSDLQEDVVLKDLEDSAAELTALSNVLSKIIDDLNGEISNFFISNLNAIATRNGLVAQAKPAGQQPAVGGGGGVTSKSIAQAPATGGSGGAASKLGMGIDCATDCSKRAASIRAAGLDFVGRYYRTPHSSYDPLTFAEVKSLSAAGLDVVALWESASDKVEHFAYSSGVDEGTSAYRQALLSGQLRDTPIYFAVDFDATQAQVSGSILDYFRGVSDGFGTIGAGAPVFKIGVYGSGLSCSWLKNHGLVTHTWLALSRKWAGFNYSDWNIKQGGALSNFSFDHDSNSARADYGGFRSSQ